jgi:hypothetical protein
LDLRTRQTIGEHDLVRHVRRFLLAVAGAGLLMATVSNAPAAAQGPHDCPANLGPWQSLLQAGWIDCHRVSDLTTTGNPYTDPNGLTGMGSPPPSSGALHSKYSRPTAPAVPGLQIDGWFSDDGCDNFQQEPATTAKNGAPFIATCVPSAPGECLARCHHDGQFVIRIPDSWNGQLLSTGTPGIRDAFASDYVFGDYALEKGWAYASQDKGNMGANYYRAGCDETGSCTAASWPGACTASSTPWCPAAAIQEWTYRILQLTARTKQFLASVASGYGVGGVTKSYVAGISNGGYQTRRALEVDSAGLYDGGVDWEGTLFVPTLPSGVTAASSTTGFNLFTYLPTSLANEPGAVLGDPGAQAALAAVGFNAESQPLWPYHYSIYWGLTQKVYRLEFDPEYTGYTCSGPPSTTSCVSPPAEVVPPQDPDASYDYRTRLSQLPALASRLQSVANTGDIKHPLITLHGDQDSLLPIKTDSDLYAQMVRNAGHDSIYRYYVVRGGNHVDSQFDDHYGFDDYGNKVLRPMLPCVRASLDALDGWISAGRTPTASHEITRPANASADQLANTCDLQVAATPQPQNQAAVTATPFSRGAPHAAWWLWVVFAAAAFAAAGSSVLRRRLRSS